MMVDDKNQCAGWRKFLPLLVILAGLIAYHNSFSGTFILDDEHSIVQNNRVHRIWPPWAVMAGTLRPVVDLSFAVNYALGGLNVWGYHAVNLAIHLLAALTLYGIVRRTLLIDGPHPNPLPLRGRGDKAAWLALAVASIWVVHPLNTQAVDYIVQRAELMMGLFYLLALYCVIRGYNSGTHTETEFRFRCVSPNSWFLAAVGCCALGMASKPIIGTAPLVILLYDRLFLSGAFAGALRRRGWMYLAMAATWLIFPITAINAESFAKYGAGFTFKRISPLEYAMTQPGVFLHYLKIALWPHPLVFDYFWPVAKTVKAIVAPTFVLGVIAFVLLWAARRIQGTVFLAAWFFIILLPTSSFIPLADPIFEHRMYLPLMAVVTFLVVGAWEMIQKYAHAWMAVFFVVAAATTLSFVTMHRHGDYRSALALWNDTVLKRPDNPRAHNNLGNTLTAQENFPEAIHHYEEALRLMPSVAELHDNYANVLVKVGRWSEAVAHYEQAIALKPGFAKPYNNLGNVIALQGNRERALAFFTEALRVKPDFADPHYNLGVILMEEGKTGEAIDHYRQAIRLNPQYAEAYNNLGLALAGQGKLEEATEQYRQALRVKPDYVDVYNNMGIALAEEEKLDEAIGYYQEALRRKPQHAQVHNNLGIALARKGMLEEAIAHFSEAIRIEPGYAAALQNMRRAQDMRGKRSREIR